MVYIRNRQITSLQVGQILLRCDDVCDPRAEYLSLLINVWACVGCIEYISAMPIFIIDHEAGI